LPRSHSSVPLTTKALIAESNEEGLGQNSPKIDNQSVKEIRVKEKSKAGRPKRIRTGPVNPVL
jgi:hypothetical protein